MATILRNQAETYARSVDDLLREDHHWAMKCRDAEEAIRVGLALFDAFEDADSSWRAAVRRAQAGQAEDLRLAGEVLREVSRIMHSARARALELIRQVEVKGYAVEGAARYVNAMHVPFDDRRLEVPVSREDVAAFVSAGPKAPDVSDDADDDL